MSMEYIKEGSGWGTRVYLWQIHVDIWQNQYNIVKLIKNNNNKKKTQRSLRAPTKENALALIAVDIGGRNTLE